MFLAYFVLFKVILIVFYFINNLFMRKRVSKLTQVSIKIFKISQFSFTFKLNEKKVSLVWTGGGVTVKCLLKQG